MIHATKSPESEALDMSCARCGIEGVWRAKAVRGAWAGESVCADCFERAPKNKSEALTGAEIIAWMKSLNEKGVCPPHHKHAVNCFRNHGCRCDKCELVAVKVREDDRLRNSAWRAEQARIKAEERRAAKTARDTEARRNAQVHVVEQGVCPPHHKHGTTCYVSHKCRCESCSAAGAEGRAKRSEGAARRRLRAEERARKRAAA